MEFCSEYVKGQKKAALTPTKTTIFGAAAVISASEAQVIV